MIVLAIFTKPGPSYRLISRCEIDAIEETLASYLFVRQSINCHMDRFAAVEMIFRSIGISDKCYSKHAGENQRKRYRVQEKKECTRERGQE